LYIPLNLLSQLDWNLVLVVEMADDRARADGTPTFLT
jgi:hypothetical protein